MRQRSCFIILSVLIVGVAVGLAKYNLVTAVIWLIGIMIGFVVQRSKFCFAAAIRDLILFRDGTLTRAVLLLIALSTAGFAVIQYMNIGGKIPGKIYPAGLHDFMGAVLFGFGMVLAGGCVSSSVMRAGEWFGIYWIVVAGILAGSVLAALTYPWWSWAIAMSPTVYLPQTLGWIPAILLQVSLFVMLVILIRCCERK